MQGDEVITQYLQEDDSNFIFINAGNILMTDEPINIFTDDYNVLCFSKEYLKQTIINPYDNWFYRCDQPDHVRVSLDDRTYVKVPINTDGLTGYIRLYMLMLVLYYVETGRRKIFYIVPKMNERNNEQYSIDYSVSFRNAFSSRPNYVSANHCQQGSKLLVYNIKICDGDNCRYGQWYFD